MARGGTTPHPEGRSARSASRTMGKYSSIDAGPRTSWCAFAGGKLHLHVSTSVNFASSAGAAPKCLPRGSRPAIEHGHKEAPPSLPQTASFASSGNYRIKAGLSLSPNQRHKVIKRSNSLSAQGWFPLDLIDGTFLPSAGFWKSFGLPASPCYFLTFSIRKSSAVCERQESPRQCRPTIERWRTHANTCPFFKTRALAGYELQGLPGLRSKQVQARWWKAQPPHWIPSRRFESRQGSMQDERRAELCGAITGGSD
jgi:hypothetical protein